MKIKHQNNFQVLLSHFSLSWKQIKKSTGALDRFSNQQTLMDSQNNLASWSLFGSSAFQ